METNPIVIRKLCIRTESLILKNLLCDLRRNEHKVAI